MKDMNEISNSTPRSSSESRAEMIEVVLPNDGNPLGNILGGRVMHLIDIAGAIAAHRHSRGPVVTASMDSVDFTHAIRVGQMVVLQSQITAAFRTSMEVKVDVYCEDYNTSRRLRTSTAYLTFVAIDAAGKPRPVPPLLVTTEAEKLLYQEACLRRQERLARHQRNKGPA
ncbi:MAG: acyl-CoA thioesterase [Acidobacteria bacterium]|nr:acyl-CoA thioesterase [Acidobacteriota bacterium]MBI3658784.1 acyl-CoA thioesterase [Acidobacteriota bacterium]